MFTWVLQFTKYYGFYKWFNLSAFKLQVASKKINCLSNIHCTEKTTSLVAVLREFDTWKCGSILFDWHCLNKRGAGHFSCPFGSGYSVQTVMFEPWTVTVKQERRRRSIWNTQVWMLFFSLLNNSLMSLRNKY